MAVREFVDANEVFHHGNDNILTVWGWLNGENMTNIFLANPFISVLMCTWWKNWNTKNWYVLTHAMFSSNVYGWASRVRWWLLRTPTRRVIWVYQLILRFLSLPLYDRDPTWFFLANELKFDDKCYRINSLSLINLRLLIIKFSSICEGQPCKICTKFTTSCCLLWLSSNS